MKALQEKRFNTEEVGIYFFVFFGLPYDIIFRINDLDWEV